MKQKEIMTGEVVIISNVPYLFLGYKDVKKKWGIFADTYGNTHERYMLDI